MFCLEYSVSPHEIEIEQRLYQKRDYEINFPDPNEIDKIMQFIVEFDAVIERIKYEY